VLSIYNPCNASLSRHGLIYYRQKHFNACISLSTTGDVLVYCYHWGQINGCTQKDFFCTWTRLCASTLTTAQKDVTMHIAYCDCGSVNYVFGDLLSVQCYQKYVMELLNAYLLLSGEQHRSQRTASDQSQTMQALGLTSISRGCTMFSNE